MSRALDFDTVVERRVGLGHLAEYEMGGADGAGVPKNATCVRRSAEYARRVAHEIRAHITGTVWKIEVSVGQQVQEDEVVAILESMKMEMPLESTEAGTVSRIVVSEGDAVEEGDVLVVLD